MHTSWLCTKFSERKEPKAKYQHAFSLANAYNLLVATQKHTKYMQNDQK